MSCKKWRYDKCIAANMSRELVRSTRGSERLARITRRCAVIEHNTSSATDSPASACASNVGCDVPRISPIVAEEVDISKEARLKVIQHYKHIESELNNRRRIMYTDAKMLDIFTTVCECPFEKRHLKPLNYRQHSGHTRSDLIMLYDYTVAFMHYDDLDSYDKVFLWRRYATKFRLLHFTSHI
ncbi:hypothetical protein OESDEN_17616 [Oesophagostomum dentatum]|uniref:Uncharacterized protein n=1 Tax=Oesophagostomum dentatum TaxID=61180 RepID=A0A0B1SCQ1_OESDE|nr:hypothetical protein OESDEN_17616 [Oesophagostomum dentatum]